MTRSRAMGATLLLLGLLAAVVVLRVVGVLKPGFTSEDWYQIGNGAFWLMIGFPVGYLLAPQSARPATPILLREDRRVRGAFSSHCATHSADWCP